MNSLGMYIASAVQTHSSGRPPSHQLSNWESDGDVKATRIAPRLALGTPLRPNQNTIAFTARNDTHTDPHSYTHSLQLRPDAGKLLITYSLAAQTL